MIIAKLKGGLGNQMFQYAFARALSLRNKTTLGFDTSFYNNQGYPVRTFDLDLFSVDGVIARPSQVPLVYRNYGGGIIGRVLSKVLNRVLPQKGSERFFHFDESKLELGPDVYLDGYWQSPKYFAGYEDVIKADFTIKALLSESVESLKKEISSTDSVCVHIRRGDYVGNKHHEVVGLPYYEQALALLQSKVQVSAVYVFSDDIEWCKANLRFGIETVFVGDEYVGDRSIGHFALMSSCKHFIIPNSSFSWWAAYLAVSADKIVIAPKMWFTDSSINTSDVTPDTWTRI